MSEHPVGRLTTRTVAMPADTNPSGDILGVYTRVHNVGRTSLVNSVEAWVRRDRIGVREKVTKGKFKFVAIDDDGVPNPVPSHDDLPDYARENGGQESQEQL